jgi:methylated-DNA-[protein]-cysteine S-methyltransferase
VATPLPGGQRLGIVMCGPALAAIDFLPGSAECRPPASAAAAAAALALDAYFQDPHSVDRVPLSLAGTPFQQRVWAALCAIEVGTTRRYGPLAQELGSGARAVAGACRRNPVPILVPCHRVVAAHGWGGYMGRTDGPELLIKRWLIEHERRV